MLKAATKSIHGFFSSNKHDVRWLILVRVCILLTILLSSLWLLFSEENTLHKILYIFSPIAALLGISLVSGLWVKYKGSGEWFTFMQVLIDALIVTGIVYITGGPISPFLFLYLPVVMATAILISRNASLGASLICTTIYSLLMWLMLNRHIYAADGSPLADIPNGGLIVQTLGLLSAMALTGIATSYLTRQITDSKELVKQSQRNLSDLSNRQKILIEGIREGIIITDLNDAIVSVNESAKKLLRITDIDIQHKTFNDLLKEIDDNFQDHLSIPGGIATHRELQIQHSPSESPTHLVYHGRILYDEGGNQTGAMFVFQDVTQLRSIESQLEMQERMARLLSEQHQESPLSQTKLSDFVGETGIMKKVFELIGRVARTDATVLITGESGTGKELVAKAIHKDSSRSKAAFIAVNCGAIPENLIESQLFGHMKGSFTGADSDYVGLFRQAEGGTIFLDEIGELPVQMQSKLLRVIQEKIVRPIGSNKDIPINVRIISATNRNLKKEVIAGNFREDLFYRLNVISIHLPPLRERIDDIPLLVNSIIKNLVPAGAPPLVSPEVMKQLMEYSYPGNVRELENILERALVLGGKAILPEHLPDTLRQGTGEDGVTSEKKFTQIIIDENLKLPVNLDDLLEGIERRYLLAALSETGGTKKNAATLLGMNFRSLRYRLQKFGLE